MNFNIGYVSVARLFPTQFQATVFGVVNFVAHCITIGAPLVAEFEKPVPFYVFCLNSFLCIIAAQVLVELDKIKSLDKVQKRVETIENTN